MWFSLLFVDFYFAPYITTKHTIIITRWHIMAWYDGMIDRTFHQNREGGKRSIQQQKLWLKSTASISHFFLLFASRSFPSFILSRTIIIDAIIDQSDYAARYHISSSNNSSSSSSSSSNSNSNTRVWTATLVHTARGTEHDRGIKSIPRNGIPHTAEWYKISLGLPDAAAATTTT